MTIARELLEFSAGRPAWQQDLMRRICTQDALQPADIEQALHNLKVYHGLAADQQLIPLQAEHLSERPAAPLSLVRLGAISDVRNANQLAPNQHLPFALEGITLIYGDNGSGKTGYSRIVKQLCRARRDKTQPLLGNVYKGWSQPAEADITYLVADNPATIRWKDGNSPPSALSQISVFDASSAPLYADQQNEIEYLPWGLDVLPSLGRACQTLSQRVQVEISHAAASASVALPQQMPGSAAETLIRHLNLDTSLANLPSGEDIRKASSWSEQDETEVKRLESEMQKLSEPAKAAAQSRRFKVSVDNFRDKLVAIDRLLAPEAIETYRDQIIKTQAAREAASVAAKRSFDAEPLGAVVGTAAWQKLYEMAEQFNSVAYPGEAFPAVISGKVCLLCQQPFGEQAADRMGRFKRFMQDTSQRDARAQDTRLNGFVTNLETTRIPTNSDMELQFTELSVADASFLPLRTMLAKFLSEADLLKNAAIQGLKRLSSLAELPSLDRTAVTAAQNYAASLEDKAKAFDSAMADTAVITDLKKRHGALLARRQLSSSVATILARRADIEKYHKLQKCKDHCDDTYQISKRNSEFRATYLTADFETEVKKQVKLLGLGYLPIKIDAKTEKGTSYVGIGLQKVMNARNMNILSEGEFRGLALACFFAEITTIPNQNGIVLDDPVSSLDHRHIRKVALRLVDEAKLRSQVIVFTHDLSFYYELVSAAADAQVPVARHWIQYRRPDEFGIVIVDDGPWQVKKTKDRVKVIENLLMRIPEEGQSAVAFAKDVVNFYTHLREAWERLVEECLLRDVVGRFQPGVHTVKLRGLSVTNGDYLMIFKNMKRTSEFSGHDWATGREGSPPSKEDMHRDLGMLKGYEKELAKRSEELTSERKKLEEPPKAPTGPPAASSN